MAGDRPAVGLPACELSCGLSLVAWPLPRAGISLKTQILYVIVFCTRYMDLFWNFASLYNWCMKVRPSARLPARTDHADCAAAAADQTANAPPQLLFITSSVGIVFVMLRGHLHGRLVVAYDPATDCKVGCRGCSSAPPACVCARTPRTRRTTPANSGLPSSAVYRPAPPDRSGRSTG
jgi:hypothetical protein